MINRTLQPRILDLLRRYPAVAILGPRQVGKTTLALHIQQSLQPQPAYLDLARVSDIAKLTEASLYLHNQTDNLVICDEIQHLLEAAKIAR